jgi:hypothetical protein
MPEQTDRRRSWWGILSTDKSPQAEQGTRTPQAELFPTFKTVDVDKSRYINTANDTALVATANGVDSDSKAGGTGAGAGAGVSVETTDAHEESPALRRASSKMDLFKKATMPKRTKTKGSSKFATISTAWSTKSTLSGRAAMGSVSSTTVDLNHFEKTEELNDIMEFTVSEQYELVDGERERDVVSLWTWLQR